MSTKLDRQIDTLKADLEATRRRLRILELLTLVNNETNQAQTKMALAARLRVEMQQPGLVVAGAGALANAAGTVAAEHAGMAGQIAKWERETETHLRNAFGTAMELGMLLGLVGGPEQPSPEGEAEPALPIAE